MRHIRMISAGESHGPGLTGILEGLPAGLVLDRDALNRDLARRCKGYGRGGRMAIEQDRMDILSGVRGGVTLGSPVAFSIRNRDWENWKERMDPWIPPKGPGVTIPRPGHADHAGAVKTGHHDIRNVLERASARETAVRVGAGSLARQLLNAFHIRIVSRIAALGPVCASRTFASLADMPPASAEPVILQWAEKAEGSPFHHGDPALDQAMKAAVDRAKAAGDTLGGVLELAALGVPPGLGHYTQWDLRLDTLIAGAVMSIPGIKAVEIGPAMENACLPGSRVHDGFVQDDSGRWTRSSFRAGGLEGGVTNGQPILVRAAMKPIPTLTQPLASWDRSTGKPAPAHCERSDTCALAAAAVVGEAMLALCLADAFCGRYGHDSMEQMRRHVHAHSSPDGR